MKLTKPQIVAILTPLVGVVAGYFGHDPIQELRQPEAPTVDVTVEAPASTGTSYHTHPPVPVVDWEPIIDAKIKAAIKANNDEYH